MGNFITVTSFELTVKGEVVETVGNMMFLKIRVEYAGGPNGILNEDFFIINIDNSVNDIFDISGIGNTQVDIFGDNPIGKVGERFYKNEPDGSYSLIVVFDDGYEKYYGGNQISNITGWLETSVVIEYKGEVTEPGVKTTIEIDINGIRITKDVNVKPGGGSEPDRLDSSGYIIGKSWRYGDNSGNLSDLPEVSDNDYAQFELLGWRLYVAYQNLTWRDLRASGGEKYFTTAESLRYSNTHPDGERYQSAKESYLQVYAKQISEVIDSPYHHLNAVIDDYLAVGTANGVLCSSHEYIKDSLRIIRVVGREENNAWWGRDSYRALVDRNFLVYNPGEPVDRYLPDIYFENYRGLTMEEFLKQMHREGQMLDKNSVDDILTFDYVDNTESPFSANAEEAKIAHFNLKLGDLHFGDTNQTINLVGTDMRTVFANIPAKNLPYAYWIYFDTEAVEAVLDHDGFNYYNAVTFKYEEETRSTDSSNLWVKLEDMSAGSAVIVTELRIKKVDENAKPIPGIKFVLTKTSVTPPLVREAVTTVNGTVSFTLDIGLYTLVEIKPEGSSLIPLAPMEFELKNYVNFANLLDLLMPDYPDREALEFKDNVNIITNKEQKGVCVVFMGSKKTVGKELTEGQFQFVVLEDDEVIATGTNTKDGEIVFNKV